LWRDASQAERAAEALKLTARDLHQLEIVDRVLDEPVGGAHRDPAATMQRVAEALREELEALAPLDATELVRQRRARFRRLGRFTELEGDAVRAPEPRLDPS
jgi:acetyl-CoA carboxylase carboxyl transferase subunit alpha